MADGVEQLMEWERAWEAEVPQTTCPIASPTNVHDLTWHLDRRGDDFIYFTFAVIAFIPLWFKILVSKTNTGCLQWKVMILEIFKNGQLVLYFSSRLRCRCWWTWMWCKYCMQTSLRLAGSTHNHCILSYGVYQVITKNSCWKYIFPLQWSRSWWEKYKIQKQTNCEWP
jgi:hypothetical protein